MDNKCYCNKPIITLKGKIIIIIASAYHTIKNKVSKMYYRYIK